MAEYDGAMYLIDGARRLNKWVANGDDLPRDVIVVAAYAPAYPTTQGLIDHARKRGAAPTHAW